MEKSCKVLIAILIVVFSFVKSNNSYGQNLVDNWSFEDTTICPTAVGQIIYAQGWVSNSGTPDYFNSCNQGSGVGPFNVNVPQNRIDYQNSKSGLAYAGILTFALLTPNVREFMGSQLNQNLQIGQKYFVSLYVSRAVNHTANYNMDVANNKIGVQFTTFPQTGPNPATPNNISQVYTDSIISDTLHWIQIKGSFIADSNYQYISVGNFFDGVNTTTIQYGTHTLAYYFFDDICVSPDSLYCDLLSGISIPKNVNTYQPYISYTQNGIIISSKLDITEFQIYNSLGQIVASRKAINENQVTVNTDNYFTGIYFVKVKLRDEKVYNLKVVRW